MRSEIKELLELLTPEEFQEFVDALIEKDGNSKKEIKKLPPELLDWYSALQKIFQKSALYPLPSLRDAIRIAGSKQTMMEMVQTTTGFINTCCPGMKQVEFKGLRDELFRLAVLWVQENDSENVTFRGLISPLRRLPQIVEMYYPGYATAGMLKAIISGTKFFNEETDDGNTETERG